jgi:hypothetical protein
MLNHIIDTCSEKRVRLIAIGLLVSAWIGLFLAIPSITIAGDFYTVYHGARTLLAGNSPYSDAALRELQQLWPSPHSASGFPYPLPLAMVVAPLALLPVSAATIVWLLIGCVLAFSVVRLRADWPNAPLLPLLWMPLFDAVWSRQVTLVWFGLVVVLLLALRSRHAWVAGLCIALLPIKPQVGLLFALYGLVRGWNENRRVVGWAVAFGVLVWGGSLLIQPTWIADWLAVLPRYETVNNRASLFPWSLVLVAVTWHLPWPSRLAAAQVALFPLNAVYTPLPLLLVGMSMGNRLALICMAVSWLYLPFRDTGSAPLVYLTMIVPIMVGAYLDRRQKIAGARLSRAAPNLPAGD